jgi:hypothetical protein
VPEALALLNKSPRSLGAFVYVSKRFISETIKTPDGTAWGLRDERRQR